MLKLKHISTLFRLSIFAVVLLFATEIQATHIVGGVINYEHRGGTSFDITMRIYRDCGSSTPFDGAPGAGTRFAEVGLFEQGTNTQVRTINLNNPVITPVLPSITNPCLTPGPECVEEGVYTSTFTVPDATKGYYLSYVRCCRNGTINNITVPGSTGATYYTEIPPAATYPNSNPVFTTFPPLFICQGAPIVYNHSAVDADGDSLFYELCTPFTGGSPAAPAPGAVAGPYTNINWAAGYSTVNPLGGATPISLHPGSGVMLGTPNTVGQFVVGVCVKEFRGGVLLSETIRDFQFNVRSCNIPIANIPSFNINPTTGIGDFAIECDDFRIPFNQTSSGAVSFWWDFGVPGISTDTAVGTNPVYTYVDTGNYLVTLVATNAAGCKDTTYAWVRLFPIFIPDYTFDNHCIDSIFQFTDISTTTAGMVDSWYWQFGDGDTSTNRYPTHKYSLAGTYVVSLTVTTDKGCLEVVNKNAIIHPLPNLSFTTSPLCINTPVTFTNTSTGTITSYEWDFGDGSPTTAAINPAHTFTATGAYNITLRGVTNHGCKDTIVVPIVINPLPTITITSDTAICVGTSTRISASGGFQYAWSPAATLSSTSVGAPLATPITPTRYTVTVTDVNSCVDTSSVFVGFLPPPMPDAGPDTSICLNPGSYVDSVQLNASGGTSYSWSPVTGLSNPIISNPVAKPTVNTTYVLTIVDGNNCTGYDSVRVTILDPSLDLIATNDTGICFRDSIEIPIIDQGVSNYSWSPVIGVTAPNTRQPIFYPADTTLYILTVRNYCYNKSDSVTINVFELPPVDAGPLDSICIGENYDLNATGALTYAWRFDPTLSALNISNPNAEPSVTTNYHVTGTDVRGCVNTDSVDILVYLPPNITMSPVPVVICLGDNVQLNAAGGVGYRWWDGSTLNDSLISNPISTPIDTTTYYVEVTNIHGCTNTDSITLNVQKPIEPGGQTYYEICQKDAIHLSATGGKYYEWKPDIWLTDNRISDPFARPDTTITYTVNISNDCFQDSIDVQVWVNPLPIPDAGIDDSIFRGLSTQLNGSGGDSYAWYPSIGLNNPFINDPTASPFNTTDFILFATNIFGCTATDTVRIKVIPYTLLLVPTAFSPNGDGTNDIFRVAKHLNIDKMEAFNVYNRWGQLVFSTNDIDEGWDGTFDGVEQPLDVFAWYIKAVDYEGNVVIKSGNVTLIR